MKRFWVLSFAALALLSAAALGQAAAPDPSRQLAEMQNRLSVISADTAGHPALGEYLLGLKAEVAAMQKSPQPNSARLAALEKAVGNAGRMAGDIRSFAKGSSLAAAPFVCYPVPAISSEKRLPDTLPVDGRAGDRLALVAARGEFEPASFVLAPLKKVGRLELKASSLRGNKGELPASCLDIKVIKCWYQAGTAWHSYFSDPTRREFVPELLLNDENLIRVDMDRKDNYLRVDYPQGPQYVWISSPPEVTDKAFDDRREPVADSPTLLPVALEAGSMKQFWVTIRVPEKAPAGIYSGTISFLADGRPVGAIGLQVRVLPFELPDPKTYYDLEKPFLSFMYGPCALGPHLANNGNDWDLAEKRLRAEMKSMREHNLYNYYQTPNLRSFDAESKKIFTRNLEIAKAAGFKPPLFGSFSASGGFFWPKDKSPDGYNRYIKDAEEALNIIERVLGHRQAYFFGFDEPGKTILLSQQDAWKDLQAKGIGIYSTGKDSHFGLVGFSEEISNYSGSGIKRENAAKWHALGHRIMSYAGPHTGPENPDFARRNHGLLLYKAWYDGTGNYTLYDPNYWNDFGTVFRSFSMFYPTRTGVIGTMAWEGFREGIDDIRYATLLKQLAEKAIAGSDIDNVHAAKKALLWLETLNEGAADLNNCRLEMINYILDLQKRVGGAA